MLIFGLSLSATARRSSAAQTVKSSMSNGEKYSAKSRGLSPRVSPDDGRFSPPSKNDGEKRGMTMTTLSPAAQKVVEEVLALREYTRRTGFRTTRSQNELIQSLNGRDLADGILALNEQ